MRRAQAASRRRTNFRQSAVRIARLVANRSGVLRCAIAKVAIYSPLDRPDWILRLHLPSGSEAFWVLLALS